MVTHVVQIFSLTFSPCYDQCKKKYFFAAKDGEALYSQQKQDWELTVAQIMNFLLQNSDLN